jgi:hypothetical protein
VRLAILAISATRTMKNSSRLELTMEAKRRRSSAGTEASAASFKTRSLKLSQLKSRL